MRIAIMGTGGVGGYYGGLLARAGHEVAFIARGDHLRAIKANGLKVRSIHGDFEIHSARATDDPAEVGPVGLTIFTVKTYDTEAAAELMRPLVGEQTVILPLQNGVESAARLRRTFGPQAVIGGLTQLVAFIAAPGVIQQESQFRRVVLGELDGRRTPRLEAICAALKESGADAEVTETIEKALWTKLLFIASFAGLSSVTRSPAGPLMACDESRLLLNRAMREVEAVARAKGIPMDADIVEKTMAFAGKLEPTTTASMQRDVIAGRRTEYDAINGAVVRAGRETAVPTPVHEFIWTCLKVADSMAKS